MYFYLIGVLEKKDPKVQHLHFSNNVVFSECSLNVKALVQCAETSQIDRKKSKDTGELIIVELFVLGVHFWLIAFPFLPLPPPPKRFGFHRPCQIYACIILTGQLLGYVPVCLFFTTTTTSNKIEYISKTSTCGCDICIPKCSSFLILSGTTHLLRIHQLNLIHVAVQEIREQIRKYLISFFRMFS